MNSKQDILNAFRERFQRVAHNGGNPSLLVSDIEQWLLNALTEFEREIREELLEDIIDFVDDPNEQGSWSKLQDYLHTLKELEKEKRT